MLQCRIVMSSVHRANRSLMLCSCRLDNDRSKPLPKDDVVQAPEKVREREGKKREKKPKTQMMMMCCSAAFFCHHTAWQAGEVKNKHCRYAKWVETHVWRIRTPVISTIPPVENPKAKNPFLAERLRGECWTIAASVLSGRKSRTRAVMSKLYVPTKFEIFDSVP